MIHPSLIMCIAFLCTSGLDNASPRGRWLPIATELAMAGHEPHLLLLHPTFDRMRQGEADFMQAGVHIQHVAQMHVYGLPGERRYFGAVELAQVSWHAARALENAAVALKPDIIHICKPQPINGLAGWQTARRLGRPFFVDCDDYEAGANRVNSGAQRAVIRWWEDHLPRHAKGVTVNTRFLFDRVLAQGVPATRIVHVPNGVNETKIVPMLLPPAIASWAGCPIAAYVGTMSTIAHGVDLLLDAFSFVLKTLPDAKLLMVGDGDDRLALQLKAKQLGIHHALHWTGRVSPEEARRYFTLAACSIDPVSDMPAMRGRSPLKIVESLAAGVPVVTGDVGDRRDMLGDGAAGVLVQPGNSEALANGMISLLSNTTLQNTLPQGAREQCRRYLWPALSEKWLSIYSQ
jgi:glycosyltransferase involved in cell wall biosynthesis